MSSLLSVLEGVFFVLVLIGLLAFYGYRFYERLVAEETEKHAHRGKGH